MAKNKTKGKIIGFGIGTGICALLLAGSIVGTTIAVSAEQVVNQYFDVKPYKVVSSGNTDEDTEYYKKKYSTNEAAKAHDKEIGENLQKEGAVLLKNDNNALPLSKGNKVSLFSLSSYDVVTCGAGSANITAEESVNMKDAFEGRGLTVNPTLWKFYEAKASETYTYKDANDKTQTALRWGRSQGSSGKTGSSAYKVNEISQSEYGSDVKASYSQYGDAAIVVIARRGGELYDLPEGEFQDGTDILELTTEEKDLLKAIKADSSIKKTIVLLNTTNAMNCGFLEDSDLGVDACLWIGYTGAWGLNGIADLLVGNASPSGRLVDTYCYDYKTAPSMVGYYTDTYTNYNLTDSTSWYSAPSSLDGNGTYTLYDEGIYIGYKYYETRYEDMVLGNTTGYDYNSEVAFAFGYGSSYTTFDWSDYTCKYSSSSDEFTINVTVTNTGNVASKDVVEIYFQSPYTEYDKANNIEKASIELCGFAKTDELKAGEKQTVTITVPREELAAYDSNGAKTYILDAGDYYLTAGKNAHDALNNILTEKGKSTANGMDYDGNKKMVEKFSVANLDDKTYSKSSTTGETITNQFDNVSLSYYGISHKMLTRQDWIGTFPTETPITATQQMIGDMNLYKKYPTTSTGTMPTMGASNGLTLAMMRGLDYDDSAWDDLLDQLTFEEMATVIGEGFHNTASMPSVSKPATIDDNGPQGFTTSLVSDGSKALCAYSDENIMAATFNQELIEQVGECIGEDMLHRGAQGLYGPAMDTHRSAYGGRNFEYYSEDGFLAGKIAAAECKGIQSNGCYVYIKHFVLNDQETLCRCVSTFSNEQAVREIYLKPFEIAITEGGASNVMNSFARIGCTWSGAHKGLMTNVLRGEWGMKGFAITDFSGNALLKAYGIGDLKSFDVVYGLLAGTDTWDSSATNWTDELIEMYSDNAEVANAMRQASHRILYTVVNSNAMNGISTNDRVVPITPWWKTALYCLIGATACGTVVCGVFLTLNIVKSVKAKKKNA